MVLSSLIRLSRQKLRGSPHPTLLFTLIPRSIAIFVEISEITTEVSPHQEIHASDKLLFLLEKRCSRPCQLQWFAIRELNCAVNGTRRNTAQSHCSLSLRQAKISRRILGAKESSRMSRLDNRREFHQPGHKYIASDDMIWNVDMKIVVSTNFPMCPLAIDHTWRGADPW